MGYPLAGDEDEGEGYVHVTIIPQACMPVPRSFSMCDQDSMLLFSLHQAAGDEAYSVLPARSWSQQRT